MHLEVVVADFLSNSQKKNPEQRSLFEVIGFVISQCSCKAGDLIDGIAIPLQGPHEVGNIHFKFRS